MPRFTYHAFAHAAVQPVDRQLPTADVTAQTAWQNQITSGRFKASITFASGNSTPPDRECFSVAAGNRLHPYFLSHSRPFRSERRGECPIFVQKSNGSSPRISIPIFLPPSSGSSIWRCPSGVDGHPELYPAFNFPTSNTPSSGEPPQTINGAIMRTANGSGQRAQTGITPSRSRV